MYEELLKRHLEMLAVGITRRRNALLEAAAQSTDPAVRDALGGMLQLEKARKDLLDDIKKAEKGSEVKKV
jgi:hypothetical protein